MAYIEPAQCVGCLNRQKLCQFRAIEYSAANEKCYINPLKILRCGVCRNACKKDAINLIDKEDLPQFQGVW